MALITDTDFSTWQAHYVAKTLWTDEQFRRVSESARCVTAYGFQRRRAEDCESAHAARRTAELEIVSFVRERDREKGSERHRRSAGERDIPRAQNGARSRRILGHRVGPGARTGYLQRADSEDLHTQPRTTSANSQKIGCRGPNSRGNSSFSQPDERNGSRINAPLVTQPANTGGRSCTNFGGSRPARKCVVPNFGTLTRAVDRAPHHCTGAVYAGATKIDVLAGFANRSRFCCPRLTSV